VASTQPQFHPGAVKPPSTHIGTVPSSTHLLHFLIDSSLSPLSFYCKETFCPHPPALTSLPSQPLRVGRPCRPSSGLLGTDDPPTPALELRKRSVACTFPCHTVFPYSPFSLPELREHVLFSVPPSPIPYLYRGGPRNLFLSSRRTPPEPLPPLILVLCPTPFPPC